MRVPVAIPTAMSTRTLDHRDYILVTVTDSDGAIGTGYTYAGTSAGAWVARAVNELLAPHAVGKPARGINELYTQLAQEFLLVGRRGGLIRALSALDIALWDLLGQTTGLSLRALLGSARSSVPAYASGGYYRPGDPLENIREEVARQRARGFADYKMKVGGLPVARRRGAGRGGARGARADRAARARRQQRLCAAWPRPSRRPTPSRRTTSGGSRSRSCRTTSTGTRSSRRAGRSRSRRARSRPRPGASAPAAGARGPHPPDRRLRVRRRGPVAQGRATRPPRSACRSRRTGTTTCTRSSRRRSPTALVVEHFALEEGVYNFEELVEPATRMVVADGAVQLERPPRHRLPLRRRRRRALHAGGRMKGVAKLAPGPGNVAYADRPDVVAGPGEVVIELLAAGICGTDLHIEAGEYPCVPPVTMGHEFCGIVAELGDGVDEAWAGARVTSETFFSTCGRVPLVPRGTAEHLPAARLGRLARRRRVRAAHPHAGAQPAPGAGRARAIAPPRSASRWPASATRSRIPRASMPATRCS